MSVDVTIQKHLPHIPRATLVRLAHWLGIRNTHRVRHELEAHVRRQMYAEEHPRIMSAMRCAHCGKTSSKGGFVRTTVDWTDQTGLSFPKGTLIRMECARVLGLVFPTNVPSWEGTVKF
jgi:hypothetical protein